MRNFRVVPTILLVILLAILLTGCPGAYNQPPLAIATASPTEGEAPLAVSFDGSASSDPDGTISTYTWNFGDGSATATGATQAHSYTTEGVFNVILTVTDNIGATDSATITVNTLTPSIYFASDRASLVGLYNIFRMDTDGNNQARVTDDLLGNALFPSLLFNTRLKLAFASDRDDPITGTFDIFKSGVDGTLPVNLTFSTQTPYNEIEPSWSPDGSKIAFASDRTGNWEIFIMNADGSSVTPTPLTTQTSGYSVAPAISPVASEDGTIRIAFAANCNNATVSSNQASLTDCGNDSEIFIMTVDDSNNVTAVKNLTNNTYDDGALGPDLFGFSFGISTPSWSPDGTRIAFTSDRAGGVAPVDIYICDYDPVTNTCTAVTPSGASDSGYDEFGPFWLPDGEWIAFVADADGDHEIWKVNVATGATVKLAEIGDNVTPASEPQRK